MKPQTIWSIATYIIAAVLTICFFELAKTSPRYLVVITAVLSWLWMMAHKFETTIRTRDHIINTIAKGIIEKAGVR